MSKAIDVTKHLTVEEAAAELELSPGWVRGLIATGKLTAIKRGGARYFDPAEIQRYKNERQKQGRPRKKQDA